MPVPIRRKWHLSEQSKVPLRSGRYTLSRVTTTTTTTTTRRKHMLMSDPWRCYGALSIGIVNDLHNKWKHAASGSIKSTELIQHWHLLAINEHAHVRPRRTPEVFLGMPIRWTNGLKPPNPCWKPEIGLEARNFKPWFHLQTLTLV